MATELSRDEIRRLARLGAQSRLEELRREEAAIRAAFPDLGAGGGQGRGGRRAGAAGTAAETKAAKRTRRRRKMSAAERRAVSERMKKYWAERRKGR